jgi:hypothetical protein
MNRLDLSSEFRSGFGKDKTAVASAKKVRRETRMTPNTL